MSLPRGQAMMKNKLNQQKAYSFQDSNRLRSNTAEHLLDWHSEGFLIEWAQAHILRTLSGRQDRVFLNVGSRSANIDMCARSCAPFEATTVMSPKCSLHQGKKIGNGILAELLACAIMTEKPFQGSRGHFSGTQARPASWAAGRRQPVETSFQWPI